MTCLVLRRLGGGRKFVWRSRSSSSSSRNSAGEQLGNSECVAALKQCSCRKDLKAGTRIHAGLVSGNQEISIVVANALLDMYSKCGSIDNARQIFEGMKQRSVVSWNIMIQGLAQNGRGAAALEMFRRMQDEGFAPDYRTFVAALRACSNLASLEQGVAIHSQLSRTSGIEQNLYVASSLVDMYAKCGNMGAARNVFERMSNRNVVAWTALISGYAQNEQEQVALDLLSRMQDEGVAPNDRTFIAVLCACSSLSARNEGERIDGRIVKLKCLEKGMDIHSRLASSGYESDMFVASSLIGLYSKSGSMIDARRVFDRMMQHDVVSWTALISGYAQNGQAEMALELFSRVPEVGLAPNARTFIAALDACSSLAEEEDGRQIEGKLVKPVALEKGRCLHRRLAELGLDDRSDTYVASALVDMYSKCGSCEDAGLVFERMQQHDAVSWNALIGGLILCGENEQALQQLACMQAEGLVANAQTFVAVLKACGNLVALETGRSFHNEICHAGLDKEVVVLHSLVNFYGKCGSMVDARKVFDSIPSKNLVSWNALMTGYSHQGDAKQVLEHFELMRTEKLPLDGITFLAVLNGCSHAGLVDKGKEFFHMMCSPDYGITPTIEHFTCMVDLLGRAGHLEEAVTMVKQMPIPPSLKLWKTLLGAAKKWNNVEVARFAFESARKLDNQDAAAYALMAGTCSGAGLVDDVASIQDMRRTSGARKKPGQSWWSDGTGMLHRFVVGDTSHPQSEAISAKLRKVLEKHGYGAKLLQSVSEDDKESGLCEHSEKLALCCALINSSPGTTIRIGKNLRVCDDCHRATCAISKSERRIIVCRDASRFHVFQDGSCSCGGFW